MVPGPVNGKSLPSLLLPVECQTDGQTASQTPEPNRVVAAAVGATRTTATLARYTVFVDFGT